MSTDPMRAHTCNLRTWEVKAGRSQGRGQPGPDEMCCNLKKKKKVVRERKTLCDRAQVGRFFWGGGVYGKGERREWPLGIGAAGDRKSVV